MAAKIAIMAMAAAIPVIGLFVAAAIIAYQYFSKARGGPKQGGAYSDVAGANMYPGETNTQNNLLMEGFVGGMTQTFDAWARAMGERYIFWSYACSHLHIMSHFSAGLMASC